MWAAIKASFLQLLLAFVLLALAGVLGARGTVSSAYAFYVVTAVAGAVGVTAGMVLGSTAPNLNAAPHVLVAVAVLGVVIALSYIGVFTQTEVGGVVALFITGTAIAAGASPPAAVVAAQQDHAPPPPPGTP